MPPFRNRRLGIIVASVPVMVVAALLPAVAQVPVEVPAATAATSPPSAAATQRKDPRSVNSLSEILGDLDWDPAERGPLLLVAPEKTTRYQTPMYMKYGVWHRDAPAELKVPGSRGYNLRSIDDVFDRKVEVAGGVTALVPRSMFVLNLKFPPPDPYAGMSTREKMSELMGSLTPEQWRKAAASNGIGVGDMSDDQRALFRSALPDPFVVMRWTRNASGALSFSAGTNVNDNRVTLNAAQLGGVRLVVRRKLSLGLNVQGEQYASWANIDSGMGGVGAAGENVYQVQYNERWEPKGELFGFPVKQEMPNRLKPGQLNFAATALERSIPLSDAKTVGELVHRVAVASGLEIYVDPRYAGLAVYTRGESAKAADVLQALCLCVTATFREVKDTSGSHAWVMTDDVDGLATRHTLIRRWASANAALQAERQRKAIERVEAADAADMLAFGGDDQFAPNDQLRQTIAAHKERLSQPPDPKAANPDANRDLFVAMAQMPQNVQSAAQKVAQNWSNSQGPNGTKRTLDMTRVRIDETPVVYLSIPGMGLVPANASGLPGRYSLMRDDRKFFGQSMQRQFEGIPKPPFIAAKLAPEQALLVSPATPQEAALLARAAAGRGLGQFWIDVPPAMTLTALTEMVSAIRSAAPSLRVYAAVHLLHAATATPSPTAAETKTITNDASSITPTGSDINVVGETLTGMAREHAAERPIVDPSYPGINMTSVVTSAIQRQAAMGDYLRPDQPETLRTVRARLLAIAATPGLAGIVARDATPPGYDQGDQPYYDSSGTDDNDFGYTPEMRLAMLRRSASDPIDLLRGGDTEFWNFTRYSGDFGNVDLGLPFFRDAGRNAGREYVEGVGMVQKGSGTPITDWNVLRRETAEGMLNQILKAVQNDPVAGRLRLLREINQPFNTGGSIFGDWVPWVPPAAKTPTTPVASLTFPQALKNNYYSLPVGDMSLMMAQMADLKPIERFALAMGSMVRYGGQMMTRGLVIDITSIKPEDAVTLLSVFKEVPPTANAGKAAPAGTR